LVQSSFSTGEIIILTMDQSPPALMVGPWLNKTQKAVALSLWT
jgi:hypothetical protein